MGGSGGTGGSVGIGCVTVTAFTVGAAGVLLTTATAAGATGAVLFTATIVFVTAGVATLLLAAIICAGTVGIAGMVKAVGNKLVFATVLTDVTVRAGAATGGAMVATVGAGGIAGTCGGT